MRQRIPRLAVRTTVPAAMAALLAVAGCSGAEPAPSPADAFPAATEKLSEAGSVAVDVSSSGVPSDTNGVSAVTGTGVVDETTPKFQGKVTATLRGMTGAIDVIAIGDRVWMSLFTTTYTAVDVGELGAPNPAQLFRPDGGIAALLASPESFSAGPRKRLDGDVVQTYTGTLAGSVVANSLHLGRATGDFDADYGIDTGTGELRQATITGAFYAGSTSTYTVKLSDYGVSVDIEEP